MIKFLAFLIAHCYQLRLYYGVFVFPSPSLRVGSISYLTDTGSALITLTQSQQYLLKNAHNNHQLWNAYPEVVEGEVCQTHSSDVFGQLLQHLRVLCLNNKGKKNFHFAFHWFVFGFFCVLSGV